MGLQNMNYSLKKIAFLPLLFAFILVFSSCYSQPDYLSYVSDLRKDLFWGENETFGVIVWAGARETPFAEDGIKNETALCLTVKITQKEETGEQLGIKITYGDKTYENKTKFHPVRSACMCEIPVNVLPEKELTAQIIYGEKTQTLTLTSKLADNTIKYSEALKKATDDAAAFLKKNTENGKLKAEITVRLICENNRNYYFIGFVSEQGEKIAYLIDGENATILAKKN